MELRLTGIEDRLNKQYQSLDKRMSNLNSLGTAVNNLATSLSRSYYY